MIEKEFETKAIELRQKYDELVITDDDSFTAMGSYEKNAKDAITLIKNHMKSSIEEAHQKHKKLVTIQKKLIEPFDEIRSGARSKRLEYQQEQERIAREEQRKAEEEARRLAEQKRQEEIEEAEAFETKEAETLKTTPIEVPEVKVQVTAKVSGARKLWSAEVTDIRILANAVAQGFDIDAIQPNMPYLNKLAVQYKDKLNIPGVKAVSRVV
jgi:hypothetical protein